MSYGLNESVADRVIYDACFRSCDEELGFKDSPGDENLPIRIWSKKYVGYRNVASQPNEYGSLEFKCSIMIGASEKSIVHEFVRLLRANRWPWGFRSSYGRARKLSIFYRDLVVYVLSQDTNWSLVDIDNQLKKMGLPVLAGRGKTDTKAIRRKIVFVIRRMLYRANRAMLPIRVYRST